MNGNGLSIVKRDGSKENLNLDKIHKMVEAACDGINGVSASQVEMSANLSFYDGVTTQEIQDTLSHHSFINNEHFTEEDLVKELKNLCNQNDGMATLNQMPQPPQSPPNSNAILVNQMPQAPQSQINLDSNIPIIKTQCELSI